MNRQRTICYWAFNIDIVGPPYGKLTERRKARMVLSKKRLREIEEAALLAVKAKLPPGFGAMLS